MLITNTSICRSINWKGSHLEELRRRRYVIRISQDSQNTNTNTSIDRDYIASRRLEYMQVLHSLWDTETFYIWAESSALPLSSAGKSDSRKKQHPSSHPFALPGIELKDLLSQTFPWSGDGCRVEALALRLPAGISGPLPSPWLLREDYLSEKPSLLGAYSVPALGLAPGSALDLLLDMPTHPPQGTAYADSMLFWSQLALFSLELVSREQFVPAIRKSRALWKAVIDEPDQERLNIFIRSLPPSCLWPVAPASRGTRPPPPAWSTAS